MHRARTAALVLLTLSTVACDLVVEPGQRFDLGNRGRIVGSPATDQSPAKPAVTVKARGVLSVVDADVLGGSVIDGDPNLPQPAAPALRIFRANAFVAGGLVQGGLSLLSSGQPGRLPGGPGIELTSSGLSVSGGMIRGGLSADPLAVGDGVKAFKSTLDVFGGDTDRIRLVGSDAFITGGKIGALTLEPTLTERVFFSTTAPPRSEPLDFLVRDSCVEMIGGQIQGPITLFASRMLIHGSSFNLPFGEVPPSRPGLEAEDILLRGVLQDGSPIDVRIRRFGGQLVLARSPTPPPQEILLGGFCVRSLS